ATTEIYSLSLRDALPIWFAGDTAGTGSLGMGGGEPQGHYKRDPFGGAGISEGSGPVQHAAFGALRSTSRDGRNRGSADAVPSTGSRLHGRPPAHSHGGQHQSGSYYRECIAL